MRLCDFQVRDLQAILLLGDDAHLPRGAERDQKIAATIDGHIASRLLQDLDVGDFGQLCQILSTAVAQANGVAAGGSTTLKLHDLQVELGNIVEQIVDVGSA